LIPKNSTPIKNEILIDIFACGLLSKTEMRIAYYVIRYSWGFDHGKRRRDWTMPVNNTHAAAEINMARQKFAITCNDMVRRNILKRQGRQLQFNEHYKTWQVSRNDDSYRCHETMTEVSRNDDRSVIKSFHQNASKPNRTRSRATVKKNKEKQRKGPSGFDRFKKVKEEEEDLVSRALRHLEKKEQYGRIPDKSLKNVLSQVPKHLHHHIRKWLDQRYNGKHSYLKIKEALRKEGQ